MLLKVVSYSEAAGDIQVIRRIVFQDEQAVSAELDFDGLDETARHIIAYADQQPIGTARIRYLSDQLAKIERVAVLASYRGQGIGRQIMEAAIAFLDQQKVAESKVHAQSYVTAFYQKLGFIPQGEEFYEAGIPHIEMKRYYPGAAPDPNPIYSGWQISGIQGVQGACPLRGGGTPPPRTTPQREPLS